jgi:hypothetical protein
VPESKADIVFLILKIIPKRKMAPVRKKFIPGKGKNSSSDSMSIRFNVH